MIWRFTLVCIYEGLDALNLGILLPCDKVAFSDAFALLFCLRSPPPLLRAQYEDQARKEAAAKAGASGSGTPQEESKPDVAKKPFQFLQACRCAHTHEGWRLCFICCTPIK